MSNKYKIIWGGYKNTTISKMARRAFNPHSEERRSRSGAGRSSSGGSFRKRVYETYKPVSHIRKAIDRIHSWMPQAQGSRIPVTVTFTNKSEGEDLTYKWNFGDGHTSTAKNPVHKYTKEGKYTVKLTVTNIGGRDTYVVKEAVHASKLQE